ncbi:MAG: hypothetical protein Q8Q73_19040 [Stagnimonas sp.]|nr:hypothetical protein [Stagnimonas sp.]
MDVSDQLLEQVVREWAASQRVTVSVVGATTGGPQRVDLRPTNPASIPMRLWVADDGQHAAISIGVGSWWDRAVPLDKQSITELLSAVAAGRAGEDIRKIGRHVLGRRGYIQLPSGRLEDGHLLGIPGLRWQQVPYEPY